MQTQPHSKAAAVLSSRQEPVQPVRSGSYRHAHKQLSRHFVNSQPLVMLDCIGQSGASYLIDQFLAGLANDVAVVRLKKPHSDELSAMREVIRGVGFDPANLSLTDLKNVFTLFLSFQKQHGYRTILCVEATQSCELRLLELVRWIVNLELKEQYGLLVVVPGRPSILDALSTDSRRCIYLAPLTLVECREFLRWQVESTSATKIAQVLDFDAITRIHEIAKGEPDAVISLFSTCLALAGNNHPAPIAVDLVNRANGDAKLPPVHQSKLDDQDRPRGGRLVVRAGEDVEKEHSLSQGHVLIGRGKLCDVRIPSPSVSRHHALVISSPIGAVLVDLESTNGTFVDGRKIKEYVLEASGVISIGDCDVEFVSDDERAGWIFDVHAKERSEPADDHAVTQTLYSWDNAIKGNINSKGDKIYHVPGAAKYDATKIDESKGERWFASEDEAKAAGWRAPRK